MKWQPSPPLARLGGYAFDELGIQVDRLRADGVNVLDFGVGDPSYPTPQLVRQAAAQGLDNYASAGYPSYVGQVEFRSEICRWFNDRFSVALATDSEVTVTLGSKEAVFHFPMAVLQPGDIVLMPAPGYPPYRTGTLFAGGEPYGYPVLRENGYAPDFDAIPEDIARRARIFWFNYPNSPTGACATDETFERAVEFCRRYEIILASDEAYTELYFGEPPRSALEFGKEGIVVFQSLSKRSAMTGYRIGWACGDADIVHLIRKLKTNIDSGAPNFIQAAALAALTDENHVAAARADYAAKQKTLLSAFRQAGLDAHPSEATIYLWQKAPDRVSDVEYAKALLDPRVACAVMPGSWVSEPLPDGSNPGAGYVRWALCPSLADVEEAGRRLQFLSF
jgi:LL-diaminopimelate aminotransferase